MSNQEILEKAIQKAIDGGWVTPLGQTDKKILIKIVQVDPLNDRSIDIYLAVNSDEFYYISPFERIIFNHDFAKALWGEESVYTIGNGKSLGSGYHALLHPLIPRWQFHLKAMVIADDPIKYLGENI